MADGFHRHLELQPGPLRIEFWDMTNKQDWYVCERSQTGMASPAYVPGPYSNREGLLYAFDRFIVYFHSRG
jgi:phenylpropionate dioxygenase-like ring-hydroxylating dioxygenase large terminal subunit